jgi:hypothetical protein
MRHAFRLLVLSAVLALAGGVSFATAADLPSADANTALGSSAWKPQVPVSLLGSQMPSIDYSRVHFSTSVSFGTGFGGRSEGLQVSRLSYGFKNGTLGVSVGSHFNGARSRNGSNPFFLEGLDFTYNPSPNMMFRVQYQNLVSPLQYRNAGMFGVDPAYIGY